MENTVNNLIEHYIVEAGLFDSVGEPDSAEIGARMMLTASTLKQLRDALISIARNQGGIPSHVAQSVLKETGHCLHSHQVFREKIPGWVCQECAAESRDRLIPFE